MPVGKTYSEVIAVIELYATEPWRDRDYSHEIDFLNWYDNLEIMMWSMVEELDKMGYRRAN